MRLFFATLCASSAALLSPALSAQWTPPPGGGDDVVGDLTTSSNLTSDQQDTFSDAMGIVAGSNPGIADEINAALSNGSIGLVDISNEKDLSTFRHGAADEDTLGVEMDYKTPEEVAGTIVHEWQHVRGRNQDPGYLNQPEECREAAAYAAQFQSLCVILCDFNKPVSCDEWKRVKAGATCNASSCRAQGGSADDPPPCPCSPPGC